MRISPFFCLLLPIFACLVLVQTVRAQFVDHPVTQWGRHYNVGLTYLHDIDADGDLDLVAAYNQGEGIFWFENNGTGQFIAVHPASDLVNTVEGIALADVDGDGDEDVIATIDSGEKAVWYENEDGLGTFGSRKSIADQLPESHDIHGADIDGDGDLDIVGSSRWGKEVFWFENTDGAGTFGDRAILGSASYEPYFVRAMDVDGDGDQDFMIHFYNLEDGDIQGQLAWFENLDGTGGINTEIQFVYPANLYDAGRWFEPVDLDNDGDLDLLNSGSNHVGWFSNNGDGTFSDRQTIATDVIIAVYTTAGDLDGDGDLDIVVVSVPSHVVAWYEHLDGAGNFGPQQILTDEPMNSSSAAIGDIDSDGDLDVFAASYTDGMMWFENLDGMGQYNAPQFIAPELKRPHQVYASDLNGDGSNDVLFAASDDNKIGWYPNQGNGEFGLQKIVNLTAQGATSVFATDLDGDHDNDILSASKKDNTIAWYENLDGAGNFGTTSIIWSSHSDPTEVHAADLDGDGDMDVLSASSGDHTVAWYKNDGSGGFGPPSIISTTTTGAFDVITADLDGDGDLDVLASGKAGDTIAWFENSDGAGTFNMAQVLFDGSESVNELFAADIDGDGDLDVVAPFKKDNIIGWFENTDGKGLFSSLHQITDEAILATSVYASDMDGDGDVDVVSAAEDDNRLAWYENLDGLGAFGPLQLISNDYSHVQSIIVADIDNRNGIDILVAAKYQDQIRWFENPNDPPLPVELTEFNTLVWDNRVDLTWETLSETNNAGFEIQQETSLGWQELAFITGAGTTEEPRHYTYRTGVLPPGIHRFRLKQIDFDGQFEYSQVVTAKIELQATYHLTPAHPNPFNPETQMNLALAQSQQVRIEVFDLQGRSVATLFDGRIESNTPFPIRFEAGAYPTGIYSIQIQGEFFSANQQVILLK